VLFTFLHSRIVVDLSRPGQPALLPKHPGYHMGKAVDHASGQSLANDPGQTNATG